MNKKKIENLYKNKIKLFENYNKFYYEKVVQKFQIVNLII